MFRIVTDWTEGGGRLPRSFATAPEALVCMDRAVVEVGRGSNDWVYSHWEKQAWKVTVVFQAAGAGCASLCIKRVVHFEVVAVPGE